MYYLKDITDKDLRKLIKPFLDSGDWIFERIGKHFFFRHKNGGTVTVSKTASDKNAYRNILKDFKRESIRKQ